MPPVRPTTTAQKPLPPIRQSTAAHKAFPAVRQSTPAPKALPAIRQTKVTFASQRRSSSPPPALLPQLEAENERSLTRFTLRARASSTLLDGVDREAQRMSLKMLVTEAHRFQQAQRKKGKDMHHMVLTPSVMKALLRDVDILMKSDHWSPNPPQTVELHPYLYTIHELQALRLWQ